jgi:hypothetical protein
MSHKFGFPAMTNRALGSKSSNQSSASEVTKFLIRVTEINLDPSKGLDQIGVISGYKISSTGVDTGKILTNVYPSNTSTRKYPVINEYVWVWKILAPNSFGGQYVWEGPISLYGAAAPNANIQPSPFNNAKPPSQKVDYSQVEAGAVNVIDNNPIDASNSISPRDTFVEKSNIHPLLPFSGDVIYEGRWGNSLRLGNTSKVTGQYSNIWSTSGNNGDPITILRNGQNPNSSDFGAEPIVENINKDLSSIYLTSYQKLPFSLKNELFQSYPRGKEPTTPSQYAFPQVILNSNRVILNAKTDSVLISGQKSVGLSANESVNIDTPSFYVSSNNVKLGSVNATEPVLRGDVTVELLKQLTKSIKDLASIIEKLNIGTSGVVTVGYNAVAGNAILALTEIALQLESTGDDSLKSKTTKVQ